MESTTKILKGGNLNMEKTFQRKKSKVFSNEQNCNDQTQEVTKQVFKQIKEKLEDPEVKLKLFNSIMKSIYKL